MAFVAPSAEDFLDRYPEFIDSDPDLVSRLLANAVEVVGPSWIERHRVPAILALTAYWLEQSESKVGEASGEIPTAGPIVMEQVGPLTIRYQTGQQSGLTGRSGQVVSASTESPYLLMFKRLERMSFPAVAIV